MKILAKRLRRARDEAGYKQIEAAKKLGISNGTLSGYERSYRDPDTDILNDMAGLYGVSTDWLLGKTDQPHSDERDEKTALIEDMAKRYPDAEIMFDNLAGMTVEQLREVDDFIKFKLQKKD